MAIARWIPVAAICGCMAAAGSGRAPSVAFNASPQAGPPPPWVSDAGDGTYRNPIVYAGYSDPDVIRVGDPGPSIWCTPGRRAGLASTTC